MSCFLLISHPVLGVQRPASGAVVGVGVFYIEFSWRRCKPRFGSVAAGMGEDRDKWALAGLLYDLDVEVTNADLDVHGQETARILEEQGIAPDIIEAIRLHNEQAHGEKRYKPFHHALAAYETITGLIVATTLVYPDKKPATVKPKSIAKRMKEKAFARSVNRDTIRECELAGIPLDEFAAISLKAMHGDQR